MKIANLKNIIPLAIACSLAFSSCLGMLYVTTDNDPQPYLEGYTNKCRAYRSNASSKEDLKRAFTKIENLKRDYYNLYLANLSTTDKLEIYVSPGPQKIFEDMITHKMRSFWSKLNIQEKIFHQGCENVAFKLENAWNSQFQAYLTSILTNGPHQNHITTDSAILIYENEIKKSPLSHNEIERFLEHFEQMIAKFTQEIDAMENPKEHIQTILQRYAWNNCKLVPNIFFQ